MCTRTRPHRTVIRISLDIYICRVSHCCLHLWPSLCPQDSALYNYDPVFLCQLLPPTIAPVTSLHPSSSIPAHYSPLRVAALLLSSSPPVLIELGPVCYSL